MKIMLIVLSLSVVVFCMILVARSHAEKNVKRPAIIGVAHIALNTDDMVAAKKFYSDLLGFPEAFSMNKPDGSLMLTNFKVNDHQYVQMFPDLKDPQADRLNHVCFETTDAEQLRQYLLSQGVAEVPKEELKPGGSGDLGFKIHDPDGNLVEFMQYLPGSMFSQQMGKNSDRRISERIIHVGAVVKDQAAADHFYKDILGFTMTWYGGMRDDEVNWVDMRVPNGTDWFEYMLKVQNPTDVHTRGVMNHLALGVPHVEASYKELLNRGLKTEEKPKIGKDGKWQFNMYDPNFTRAELMEPEPVEKPCCSPILHPPVVQ